MNTNPVSRDDSKGQLHPRPVGPWTPTRSGERRSGLPGPIIRLDNVITNVGTPTHWCQLWRSRSFNRGTVVTTTSSTTARPAALSRGGYFPGTLSIWPTTPPPIANMTRRSHIVHSSRLAAGARAGGMVRSTVRGPTQPAYSRTRWGRPRAATHGRQPRPHGGT